MRETSTTPLTFCSALITVFSWETSLQLKVTKGGADVADLQPYLQSFAHITGFREGDLTAVHVHPDEVPKKGDPTALGGPVLTLPSAFSAPGKYRMFVEFQTNGLIHLTPIDIDVT